MPYNTIEYNRIQSNAKQCNTIQHKREREKLAGGPETPIEHHLQEAPLPGRGQVQRGVPGAGLCVAAVPRVGQQLRVQLVPLRNRGLPEGDLVEREPARPPVAGWRLGPRVLGVGAQDGQGLTVLFPVEGGVERRHTRTGGRRRWRRCRSWLQVGAAAASIIVEPPPLGVVPVVLSSV